MHEPSSSVRMIAWMHPLHLTLLQIFLAVGTLFAVLLAGHILRQRRNPAARPKPPGWKPG